MENLLLILLTCYALYRVAVNLFPSLIQWSINKQFYAEINWRSSHKIPVPSTGGIIFLLAILLPLIFVQSWAPITAVIVSYVALLVGWIDDRYNAKWYLKLAAQFGIGYVFHFLGFGLVDLHGILGIYELNYFASLGLTVLLVATIMNAINLVDGVDGLAGMISITSFAFFTVWFVLNDQLFWGVYAAAITSLIVAFLRFNYSPAKIFLGDTGSLFLGANISLFLLVFLQGSTSPFLLTPVALLALPVLDMARLFLKRLLVKKSPFSADKNHFHHLLIQAGANHKHIANTGLILSLFFTVATYFFALFWNLNNVLLLLICISMLGYVWVNYKLIQFNKTQIKTILNKQHELLISNQLLTKTS
jgi:UDP-N-acetylmuramyl pentapeptide phosphotransferase/UDP-N-acetylglucosamine-1-phosphate transferase